MRRLPLAVPALLLAAGLVQAWRLAFHKDFSIDELMHAHASWLTGRGLLPYRDFCDFHFPFLYQLLGAVWTTLTDDPRHVLVLRGAMLLLVCVVLVAAAAVNRREGAVAALAAPATALTILPFAFRASEIRHDTLAFALFLSALVVLSLEKPGPRLRGATFGVLMGLAAWSSQKALLYGAPVFAFLAVASLRARRGKASIVGSPGAAWAGGTGIAALAAAYLTLTRSWAGFVTYAFGWAFKWQAEYPGFSPWESLAPVRDGYLAAVVLGAIGLGATVAGIGRRRAGRELDLLLALSLLGTLGYFFLVKAPYDYNLIPFFGLLAVFAGRGVGAIARWAEGAAPRAGVSPVLGAALGTALALVAPSLALGRVGAAAGQDNAYQLEVLGQVKELTGDGDAAYDNSGSYVARPSASFFFYTDAPMRARLGEMLARRIPEDILKSGTVLFFHDARTGGLPESLRAFLGAHFKPWSGDLWLWGQSYRVDASGRLSSRFRAVRHDRYFVEPPELLDRAKITIAGRRLDRPVFDVPEGEHEITYDGPPGVEMHLLWLPRNGTTWTPDFGAKPRFSRVL